MADGSVSNAGSFVVANSAGGKAPVVTSRPL